MQFIENWWRKLEKTTKNLILDLILAKIWFPKNSVVGFTSTKYYTLLQAIIVCIYEEN